MDSCGLKKAKVAFLKYSGLAAKQFTPPYLQDHLIESTGLLVYRKKNKR